MPATSEAQQHLFALADAVKSGKVKASDVHGAARKLAKTQSHKTLREFMHKKPDAPERVEKESAMAAGTKVVASATSLPEITKEAGIMNTFADLVRVCLK